MWDCFTRLAEEVTESKEATFAKLIMKCVCIVKITFLWRGFKFKKENGPPGSPISTTRVASTFMLVYSCGFLFNIIFNQLATYTRS